MNTAKFRTTSVKRFLNDLFQTIWFDPKEGPPLVAQLEPGIGKLIVVTGENASGKSFYRRIVHMASDKCKMECINTSQESRCREGMHRVFMYGAEDWESTGYISAKSVGGAFRTSLGRKDKHVLFLDEPDIGLSDNYAAGLGQEIAESIEKSSDKLFATFIVSHSKALISQLAKINPWHMRFGSFLTLNEWLTASVVPTATSQLMDEGITRFRKLSKILDRVKKERS